MPQRAIMKENSDENKSCLVAIVAIIMTIAIGNFLFWFIDKIQDYAAIAIMTIIFVSLLIFIIRCIAGMMDKNN